MANFCTKCGAAVDPAARFCTACGTSTSAEAAPSAAAVTTASPQKSPWVKVVLIVLAVFVGIGALGVLAATFFFWQVARNVQVDETRGRVQVTTPQGTIEIGKTQVSEAELGLPIYPGATQEEGSMRVTSEEGTGGTYVFRTSDAPAKVLAFYKEKLGTKGVLMETPTGGMITGEEKDRKFVITVGRDDPKDSTTIAIISGVAKPTSQ